VFELAELGLADVEVRIVHATSGCGRASSSRSDASERTSTRPHTRAGWLGLGDDGDDRAGGCGGRERRQRAERRDGAVGTDDAVAHAGTRRHDVDHEARRCWRGAEEGVVAVGEHAAVGGEEPVAATGCSAGGDDWLVERRRAELALDLLERTGQRDDRRVLIRASADPPSRWAPPGRRAPTAARREGRTGRGGASDRSGTPADLLLRLWRRRELNPRPLACHQVIAELASALPVSSSAVRKHAPAFVGLGTSSSGRGARDVDEMLAEGFGRD
jgi:hypothetical protein